MIIISCPKCQLTLRVMGDVEEVDLLVGRASPFWPYRYKCPRCEANAIARYEIEYLPGELEESRVMDLNPHETLAALHGLGLPDEQLCTRDTLEKLLSTVPVRRVGGHDIDGSRRCYLDHLELSDGTKVYFGAGSGGAVVYRIARPFSYTTRVLSEHAE